MIPAALEWFADLCAHYAPAPIEAQLLGNELLKQFKSSNERIQVNRAFRRHTHILPAINAWLVDKQLTAAIGARNCSITSNTYQTAVAAMASVMAGQVPSEAWRMGAQRGINTGFSTTMEAAALVGYLTKLREECLLPECLYPESQILSTEYLLIAYIFDKQNFVDKAVFTTTTATDIAATLFKVHADNIRKYSGPAPADDHSEAAMALFGLTRLELLKIADNYFDVEDLIEKASARGRPVTI